MPKPGPTDTEFALFTPGEYVLNKEAAALAGKKNLDALNKKGLEMRKKQAKGKINGYASGGETTTAKLSSLDDYNALPLGDKLSARFALGNKLYSLPLHAAAAPFNPNMGPTGGQPSAFPSENLNGQGPVKTTPNNGVPGNDIFSGQLANTLGGVAQPTDMSLGGEVPDTNQLPGLMNSKDINGYVDGGAPEEKRSYLDSLKSVADQGVGKLAYQSLKNAGGAALDAGRKLGEAYVEGGASIGKKLLKGGAYAIGGKEYSDALENSLSPNQPRTQVATQAPTPQLGGNVKPQAFTQKDGRFIAPEGSVTPKEEAAANASINAQMKTPEYAMRLNNLLNNPNFLEGAASKRDITPAGGQPAARLSLNPGTEAIRANFLKSLNPEQQAALQRQAQGENLSNYIEVGKGNFRNKLAQAEADRPFANYLDQTRREKEQALDFYDRGLKTQRANAVLNPTYDVKNLGDNGVATIRNDPSFVPSGTFNQPERSFGAGKSDLEERKFAYQQQRDKEAAAKPNYLKAQVPSADGLSMVDIFIDPVSGNVVRPDMLDSSKATQEVRVDAQGRKWTKDANGNIVPYNQGTK